MVTLDKIPSSRWGRRRPRSSSSSPNPSVINPWGQSIHVWVTTTVRRTVLLRKGSSFPPRMFVSKTLMSMMMSRKLATLLQLATKYRRTLCCCSTSTRYCSTGTGCPASSFCRHHHVMSGMINKSGYWINFVVG